MRGRLRGMRLSHNLRLLVSPLRSLGATSMPWPIVG